MQDGALEAVPADLAGHWFFLAASPGMFQSRLRVESAQVLITDASEQAQQSFVEFATPRRVFRFGGRIPVPAAGQTAYGWRQSSGARAPINRSRWMLTRTIEGDLIGAHHPHSMLFDGGCALLARVTTTPDRTWRALQNQHTQLGLSRREMEALVWRDRPEPSSIAAASLRLRKVTDPAASRTPLLSWMRG